MTVQAAILEALGFDPRVHGAEVVRRPFRGLRIVTALGRPVRFFTEKQLRRMRKNTAFLEAFTSALKDAP